MFKKNNLVNRTNWMALAGVFFLSSPTWASCGVAFCSIETKLLSGESGAERNSSLDIRWESISQNQPRTQSRAISVGEVSKFSL